VGIPKVGSLILEHDLDAPLAGLDAVPDDRQPPVAILFWSFRAMVGLGVLMFTLGLAGLWARWRGTLYTSRGLHRFALVMAPAGFAAIIAGWVTTEVGRHRTSSMACCARRTPESARRPRGRRLARRVRAGLLCGLRHRHLVYAADDAPPAPAGRARAGAWRS
jgi:hypothetical protein